MKIDPNARVCWRPRATPNLADVFGMQHSKRYTNNIFAFADVQKSYGVWSAYNSQSTAWGDSGWDETFINNTVTLLHNVAYVYQVRDLPQCCVLFEHLRWL